MDQPALGLAFTVEARNAQNVRTQNYRTAGYAVGSVALVAENADAGVNLGARLAGLPTGTWIAGRYAVNATSALFARLAAPDGPYESLVLGVVATDPDGARLAGRDMNASAAGCGSGCDARALNAGTPLRARFGRLRVGNAVGSPVLGLPVPLSVEYWNGSGFVRNAQDSCTTLTSRNFTFGAFTAPLAACSTSGTPVAAGGITFASGASSSFRLTAPGVRGSVDLTPNLGATATGQSCVAGAATTATAANVSWLMGNWGGAATWDRNPTGRAAFGLYTNTPDLIYRRESY
jgi:MSHA biogenesis protein MshQ